MIVDDDNRKINPFKLNLKFSREQTQKNHQDEDIFNKMIAMLKDDEKSEKKTNDRERMRRCFSLCKFSPNFDITYGQKVKKLNPMKNFIIRLSDCDEKVK